MLLRSSTSRISLAVIALLAGLLIAGCNPFAPDKDDGGDPTPPPQDRYTAQNLFNYFAGNQADPNRDLVNYERCLHTDFTFTFTAMDAETMREGDPTFPGFWTKEEDVEATGNMFEAAISISMEFTVVDSLPAEPCDPGEPTGAQCRVYEVEVNLTVQVPDEPENTTFLVGGFANMAVTQDPFDPEQLVIYEILDRTNEIGLLAPRHPRAGGGAASQFEEPVSWGELRYILR